MFLIDKNSKLVEFQDVEFENFSINLRILPGWTPEEKVEEKTLHFQILTSKAIFFPENV